ncbi:MAG: hypothetical protein AAFZ15_00730 [Bacteroidota bacterium]
MKYPKLLTLFILLLTAGSTVAQDTIIFESQYPFLVGVIEESESNVTYRKFNENSNLAYIIEKRFITDVRYQDPEAGKLKFKPDALLDQNKLDLWVLRGAGGSGDEFSGLLHRMDDSTLILKKKASVFDKGKKDGPEVVYIFPYSQIDHIAARKQNRIVQYALIGAGTGFLVGTLTGLVGFKDDEPCDPVVPGMDCDNSLSSPRTTWEKSLTFGLATTGIGALTGGIIGGIKVKIPIEGKKDIFNAAIPRLNRMNRDLNKR